MVYHYCPNGWVKLPCNLLILMIKIVFPLSTIWTWVGSKWSSKWLFWAIKMNHGKLVFALVMDHLPLYALSRCVAKHRGHLKVKDFTCLDQFLALAFAQITYRESLHDIEMNLRTQAARLHHMGFRCGQISRNTLSKANANRFWQIYADFAQYLIGIARPLYEQDPLAINLDAAVYAFDATTIDLCLSVYPGVPFRTTKAAVK